MAPQAMKICWNRGRETCSLRFMPISAHCAKRRALRRTLETARLASEKTMPDMATSPMRAVVMVRPNLRCCNVSISLAQVWTRMPFSCRRSRKITTLSRSLAYMRNPAKPASSPDELFPGQLRTGTARPSRYLSMSCTMAKGR